MTWITSCSGGVRVQIRVQPRSSRNEITGVVGEFLRIRITAPPVDGEANKTLVKFLGQKLRCSPGKIKVARGVSGRCKLLEISGVTENDIRDKVNACCRKKE